jgi:energy-coupling factor transporter ATP-binding protein EcfA2
VYIRKIQISDVRGFREVDLDLSRPDGSFAGWTVLAGRNGSGKSTLLKAIALAAVGPEAVQALQSSFADWMRAGTSKAEVGVYLEPSSPTEDFSRPAWLSWRKVEGKSEPRLFSILVLPPEDMPKLSAAAPLFRPDQLQVVENEQALFQKLREVHRTGELSTTPHINTNIVRDLIISNREDWFLAAYGPYRRLSGHAVDAQRLMEGPEPISRVVSLFREDASLVEAVGWLREIYLLRLENKPGAADLERAVMDLLDDGLLPDGVRVDQVDSDGLWVFQNEVRLPLRELSDGYRTIAALVMDIVRHLHRTFGELQIERADDEEGPFWKVLHSGVVLIDEIDLHLHISWQKRVGFWLKRHFPNIQFIVTTHSPFICQAADPRGLIRLPAPGEDHPTAHVSDDLYNTIVNGSIDDVILTELFGVESPYSAETERLREAVAQLEAKLQTGTATDKDRQELRELRSRLPRTMASSVEQALRVLTVEG